MTLTQTLDLLASLSDDEIDDLDVDQFTTDLFTETQQRILQILKLKIK